MRVRITGCHPYSAGLAAVSGQCYRYISIITFGRAVQRSAAFRCTLRCRNAPPVPSAPAARSPARRVSRASAPRADLHRDAAASYANAPRPRLSRLRASTRVTRGLTSSSLAGWLAGWLVDWLAGRSGCALYSPVRKFW